ncbi:MAG TPA: MerR family transcriptional regulator [Solirubrobacteraceae bacterium]|nr:MerR family transcriptional regulator [Solirubrobacteraceae bacterium]
MTTAQVAHARWPADGTDCDPGPSRDAAGDADRSGSPADRRSGSAADRRSGSAADRRSGSAGDRREGSARDRREGGAGAGALTDPDGPGGARRLRIGELAQLTGTTPRTIRYYEEIGLLEGARERAQGRHRLYGEAELERLRDIVRLRDLLGLSLEQLSQMLAAESARAQLRRELAQTESAGERRRLLLQAGEHIETQLTLVRRRISELRELESELVSKQDLVRMRLAEIDRR